MEGAAAHCLAAFAALLAASAAAGDISDKIAVWGYVLDKTPTSCPFMFGKSEFSLERAAEVFGSRKAFYMNSCFSREYVEGHFKFSVNAAFDAVADGTIDGVILPQAAWYLVPSHREHYEWLREKVRSFRAK